MLAMRSTEPGFDQYAITNSYNLKSGPGQFTAVLIVWDRRGRLACIIAERGSRLPGTTFDEMKWEVEARDSVLRNRAISLFSYGETKVSVFFGGSELEQAKLVSLASVRAKVDLAKAGKPRDLLLYLEEIAPPTYR